jgi:hypothetical protein
VLLVASHQRLHVLQETRCGRSTMTRPLWSTASLDPQRF